jgi:stage V sporulation protein G
VIITEVRIKLIEDSSDRLRAFCSITFDHCFVVRDLKIIEGNNGPFVAMPSRKIMNQCPQCGTKNHLRSRYCNQCGGKTGGMSHASDPKAKLYADIAHPINAECREMIQNRVIREFELEMERSQQPGYVSRYDEEYGAIDSATFEDDSGQFGRLDAPHPPAGADSAHRAASTRRAQSPTGTDEPNRRGGGEPD